MKILLKNMDKDKGNNTTTRAKALLIAMELLCAGYNPELKEDHISYTKRVLA